MKYQTLITELEELAAQLGLKLRYEKGDFEGGFCILKDERMLVVNKKLPDARRASALAQALGEYGLENMFIKPALREYIEDEMARQTRPNDVGGRADVGLAKSRGRKFV